MSSVLTPSWRRLVYTLSVSIGLVVLCLPAIAPLLTGRMIESDDGSIHLYRSVVLEHSLLVDGWLYPRFSSGLAYGYGTSLFNFFPPTVYYIPVLIHQLGLSFISAWLAAMVLYTVAGAAGMWLLSRAVAGEIAAWVATAVFVYAPYTLFNMVTRGSLNEHSAWMILPWLLWTLLLLHRCPSRWAVALVSVTYALLICHHNVVALLASIMIVVWVVVMAARTHRRSVYLLLSFVALATGIVLSAFYWLPALLETSSVRIQNVAENLPFVDVTNSLVPLVDRLHLFYHVDLIQQNLRTPIGVSVIMLLLAFMSTLLVIYRRRYIAMCLSLWLVIGLTLFINTPASAWFWQNIPLLSYSQFAWRTLGITSIALALLCGLGVSLLGFNRQSMLSVHSTPVFLFLSLLLACLVVALSWTLTRYTSLAASTVVDSVEYEYRTGQLSLSSYGEYLPLTNDSQPEYERMWSRWQSALSDMIDGPTDINAMNISRFQSDGVIVFNDSIWSGVSVVIDYTNYSDDEVRISLDWLYVPGWRGFVDGEEIVVGPTVSSGLVEVYLAPGQHRFELSLQRTAVQQISELVSMVAALVGMLFLIFYRRSRSLTQLTSSSTESDVIPQYSLYQRLTVAGIVIASGISLTVMRQVMLDTGTLLVSPRYTTHQLTSPDEETAVVFTQRHAVTRIGLFSAGTRR